MQSIFLVTVSSLLFRVNAHLEVSRFLGLPGVRLEEQHVDQLHEKILESRSVCASDVEIFCGEQDFFPTFLSFGNGIFPSSPIEPVIESMTFVTETPDAILMIEIVNRRLCARSDHDVLEPEKYEIYHEIAENYPYPVFGFDGRKDLCLGKILNGRNPLGPIFAPPILTEECRQSAEQVSHLYASLGATTSFNELWEFRTRVALAVLFIALLATGLSFSQDDHVDEEEDETSLHGEYMELKDADEEEKVYVGVPLRVI